MGFKTVRKNERKQNHRKYSQLNIIEYENDFRKKSFIAIIICCTLIIKVNFVNYNWIRQSKKTLLRLGF